ncbi:hypothetical protein AC1031_019602 [Aphanomyces cochlioides]|nr:hypothetical protein AC1031_019602 [Aphanomyces cochlioides]
MCTINWVDTRFHKHEPTVCTTTMLKGISNYARIRAASAFDRSRTFLSITAFSREHHEIMLSDVADLNRDHSEEETRDVDDGFKDASSSDDDLTE